MDFYTAIRLISFREVTQKPSDVEYGLRRIFRWYSTTFHTPLHTVEELPLQDILVAYYESKYEDMEPVDLEAEREELLSTEVVRQKKNADRDAEAADLFMIEREMAAENAKNLKKEPPPVAPVRKSKPLAETELPDPEIPEVEIRYEDIPPEVWDTDGFGILDDPKK